MSGSGSGTPIVPPASVDLLVAKFLILYPNINVQSYTEYGTGINTDAEIPYLSFDFFYDIAVDELVNILADRSITLTATLEDVAICHLIADYIEMSNVDWTFTSQSMGSGVSFSRGKDTGPRAALNKLLDQAESAMKKTRRSGVRFTSDNLLLTKDHLNYPRRFKMTQIPAFDPSSDGFDSEEAPDLGDTTDRNY